MHPHHLLNTAVPTSRYKLGELGLCNILEIGVTSELYLGGHRGLVVRVSRFLDGGHRFESRSGQATQ